MGRDLGSLERLADDRLDAATFAYAASGSGDEVTLRANVAAWDRIFLRPKVLRDVSAVSTETLVLGEPVAFPAIVAQSAMHKLFWPDGEVEMARASVLARTILVVSMAATTSIETVSAAVPEARLWMHVTIMRDRGLTRELCQRAKDAGCRAIVLTVDCPVATRRPRSEASGLSLPDAFHLPNMVASDSVGTGKDLLALVGDFERSLSFDDVATVGEWSGGLPVVVKGVVRGDDAKSCVDAGAAAIVVSNHGGRQLDHCVPTALSLPEVVAAVGGRAEVYVDGGIRRGAHILMAMAMGASAVLLGRSVVFGLALDGAAGATDVLEEFREELKRR